MNTEGKNITKEFTFGAQKAFEIVKKENPNLIILQSRSPSCGIKQIYDGTFSGKKITGHGLFAALCIEAGYKVLDIEDIDEYLSTGLSNATPVSTPEYGLLYLSGSVLQYFLSYQFQLNSNLFFLLQSLLRFHRPVFH